MKMYFLVEGNSTEKKVYPEWLKILIPGIEQHLSYDDFRKSEQGFFFIFRTRLPFHTKPYFKFSVGYK